MGVVEEMGFVYVSVTKGHSGDVNWCRLCVSII